MLNSLKSSKTNNNLQKLLRIVFLSITVIYLNLIHDGNITSHSQSSGFMENHSPFINKNYGSIPMFFEKNQGQVHGDVKFYSHGESYTLFLTQEDVVFTFSNSNKKNIARKKKQKAVVSKSTTMKMRLIDANSKSQIVGMDKLAGQTNYLIGSDSSKWFKHVPTYSKVLYGDVYSGIDLIYRNNQKKLEYDFVIDPGADVQKIKLAFEGQTDLFISEEGNLNICFGKDQLVFLSPLVYQETFEGDNYIESKYKKLDEQTIGFEVGSYDMDIPLTIDPELVYSTFIDNAEPRAITVDSEGYVYITGSTNYSTFRTTTGAYQEEIKPSHNPYFGDYDVFVTKLNPEGTGLVYSTFLGGGGGDEEAYSIAIDSDNNAHITGITYSDHFPTTFGAFQIEFNKGGETTTNHWINCDAFVTKLNADGSSLIYSTLLGGDYEDYGAGIDIDNEGYAYVAGYTRSKNFPTTAGAYQAFCPGAENPSFPGLWIYNANGFITKLNKDGKSLIYSTYLGHDETDRTSDEYVKDIKVDNEGNAYITGAGILSGAYEQSSMFIAKLNSLASGLIYSTQIGNQSGASVSSLAIDASSNVYLTGTIRDSSFPVKNAFQPTHAINEDPIYSHEDAFMMKIHSNGKDILYSTFIGGKRSDYGEDIAVDANGKVYVLGRTGSDNLPTKNAVQENYASANYWQYDYFITQIDPTQSGQNSLLYLTYLGGNGAEYVSGMSYDPDYGFSANDQVRMGGIAVDLEANAYITGRTGSQDFPITENAYNKTLWGSEVFVTKIGTKKENLIYDQVVVPPQTTPQHILPQYKLEDKYDVFSITFRGKPDDGKVALRVVNTSLLGNNSLPIKLKAEVLDTTGVPVIPTALLGDMGNGNVGFQFNVSQNGDYTIRVEAEENSPGPFPAPFQIHLSGNIGQVKELIDGKLTKPRGIRKDILFNHVAPRPQLLSGKEKNIAQTGLFKFANPDTVSPYAVAVLVPPSTFPKGLPPGKTYKRATDPTRPLDATTPTAKTPILSSASDPSGLVIDMTQLPDPPLTQNQSHLLETVGAVIGKNDGVTVTLPMSNGVKSLILDMGSGQEIVNGDGVDFKIFAEGNYFIGVSNSPFYTPYIEFFIPVKNELSGNQELDLTYARLSSARYVLITASSTVKIDAIKALNHFADEFSTKNNPFTKVETSTITMQKMKDSENDLNPFLTLIGPEGLTFATVNGGYGNTSQFPDAAIIDHELDKKGFYRFLGNGYDILPGNRAFGSFFVRLESGGNYDINKIVISNKDEDSTAAQKTGTINKTRQRDSYLVDAVPGKHLNIVVNSKSSDLNPIIELLDPEGFLIGANDDAMNRERNSLLSLKLPTKSFYQDQPMPNPSTYRIVVSAIDGNGISRNLSESKVYKRIVQGGTYELKVFTGELASNKPLEPTVSNIFPSFVTPDLNEVEMIISGYYFSNGATVAFSGSGITVKTVDVIHSNQLRVSIDIAQNAQLGKQDVTVTNYNGKSGTGTGIFEIVQGIGAANLSWESPTNLDNLDSPKNLKVISEEIYGQPVINNFDLLFTENYRSKLRSYNIYRSTLKEIKNSGSLIANIHSSQTNFIDITAIDNNYYYQVTAVYDQGESEPSNEASVTITKVNENEIIPDNFALYQNYPNPFNPTTEIKYSIPESSNLVTLIIYDISGNEINTLVNKKQNSGIHTVVWNGRNNEGIKVASGLYFYRLQAGSFVEVKKMIMMK